MTVIRGIDAYSGISSYYKLPAADRKVILRSYAVNFAQALKLKPGLRELNNPGVVENCLLKKGIKNILASDEKHDGTPLLLYHLQLEKKLPSSRPFLVNLPPVFSQPGTVLFAGWEGEQRKDESVKVTSENRVAMGDTVFFMQRNHITALNIWRGGTTCVNEDTPPAYFEAFNHEDDGWKYQTLVKIEFEGSAGSSRR